MLLEWGGSVRSTALADERLGYIRRVEEPIPCRAKGGGAKIVLRNSSRQAPPVAFCLDALA